MNEAALTLQGYLGGDVRLHQAGETPVSQLPAGLAAAAPPDDMGRQHPHSGTP